MPRTDHGAGRMAITIIAVAAASLLLFVGLGHYALWDDEALTALAAAGVWQTGDTTAEVGHNLVAYRRGMLLRDGRERGTPPLSAYVAAPFVGVAGNSSFAARLSFAVMGLLCVSLLLRWLWRSGASNWFLLLFAIALLSNVSFFLYFRQCRYYGPAILLSVAIAHLYVQDRRHFRDLLLMALLSWALLAANYLNFAVLYLCLAVDYLLFKHREHPLTWRQVVLLVLPQIALGLPVVLIWNSLATGHSEHVFVGSWQQRLELWMLTVVDMNACEMLYLPLLALTPLVAWHRRDRWLWRGWLALMGYVFFVSTLAPQPLRENITADVRYGAPLIPLAIALGVLTIWRMLGHRPWLALIAVLILMGTNVCSMVWRGPTQWRITLADYLEELRHPPRDPYRTAADWLVHHVEPGRIIVVRPRHMMYPLMFHAPHLRYGWQFDDPPPPAFADVDSIHIAGRYAPDYFVVFGPHPTPPRELYQRLAVLPVYWRDLHRPELMLRSFVPVPVDPDKGEAIYIEALRPP